MKQRLLSFIAITVTLFLAPGISVGQTVTLSPKAIPNGIAVLSGEQYHQRIDIRFGGTATSALRGITITVPTEVNVLVASITATGGQAAAALQVAYLRSPAARTFEFSVSGTGVASNTATIEFDVTTPNSFTGIATGTKVDTVYALAFASTIGSAQNVAVAKHNNLPVRDITFSAPDAVHGDTTTAGGRFYKLAFPSLPDLSHTNISGLSRASGGGIVVGSTPVSDSGTDVLYSFYLSTDSALVERPLTLGEAAFFSMASRRGTGSLIPFTTGSRQVPRVIDRTYIRTDFNSIWSTAAGDSVAGVISLAGTQDNTIYYVYALADPAPGRVPSVNLESSGYAATVKKGYDNTVRGAFSGGVFLGRSGPLLVQHPPEFVVAGWDYDNDGGDQFRSTGVVQIPNDLPGMNSNRQKDNVSITVDSGNFYGKGAALASLESGLLPKPINTVDLIYQAQDADNPNSFKMNIILSANSGLTVANLEGTGIDSFSVASSIRIPGTDTLTTGAHSFRFDPIVRDGVTNLITSFVPEAAYNVYFVATDGTHRTVYQVMNDNFRSDPSLVSLTVRHSPDIVGLDLFSLNDFGGDGDLDVITGIDVSQMMTSADGKNLSPGPAQRYVSVFWGGGGLNSDLDVDDNGSIDLYYSTRSTFRAAGESFAYTSGNSTGADLLAAITQGNNDTHLLASNIQEDPDGRFDDAYSWDLWNYVSPEGTVPVTGTRYYLYGLMTGGSTRRLESFTSAGAISFQHPPYARIIEPSLDITVTVDEPVNVIWEASDVDNAEGAGVAVIPIGTSGRVSPNSRGDSPNIRILLSSADYGAVTTWGSITSITNNDRLWLGNSTDGSLSTGSEVELNESVDTSFVIQGNRLRNNLTDGIHGLTTSMGLQTNGGLGITYYVYIAVDQGSDRVVADQNAGFSALSPVVRAPGRITFTGTVPTNPATSARFSMPTRLATVSNEVVKLAIVPDEGDPAGGTSIDIVDIFMTVDPALWDAVDTDPNTAGIQPFTLGTNTQIVGAHVNQAAYIDGSGQLRLDFIYNTGAAATGALTFFDGQQTLVTANLRAKPISGGTLATTISLDNSVGRVSKMVSGTAALGIAIPAPTVVTIVRRATVTGTVPLQGRASSADTVTFILREVGDLVPFTDALFNAQDTDPTFPGVQVVTTGVTGAYSLTNVPQGRFTLAAWMPRHLAGHDTLNVSGGLDIAGFQPTLDGSAVDHSFLLAGDVAGYTDSTGFSVPDNSIDAADIDAVNRALFSQPGDANYYTFADVNRDLIVNATDKDFTTVNTTDNTGNTGIRPVFPTFKQAVVEGNNTEATLMLKGLPETEVRAGETFDVTVAVEGAVLVRTYEFHLSYDPEMIEVADLVSQGSLFQNYRTDLGGKNENGDLGVVNSILGQTPVGASGSATLATIRFRAINRSTQTALALTGAILIDVAHDPAVPQLTDGGMIVLSSDPISYHDAQGEKILGLILADQDAVVDFNDFVAFAGAFGAAMGDDHYDFRADLNGDDAVDFADFLVFAQNFGRTAIDAPAARRAGKLVLPAGGNSGASVQLAVAGEAKIGELLTLTANIQDAQALQGWGFSVEYDATQYEFVEARTPEGNLLESAGGEAPLFLQNASESGVVSLASAVSSGPVANGEGVVAELVFRPIGDIENSLFDIANGVVFDPNQLQNIVGTPGSLEVRAIPTSFALNQNFPNPFNPETTISYDLADGGRVELEIYNVMGQMVNQLVSEEQAAGRYRVVWDGSDAVGRNVASGVYFYRLNTTQFNAVRKLMLLK